MIVNFKRTNPADVANLFIRNLLSDVGAALGGFSPIEAEETCNYFNQKCPYTGKDLDKDNIVWDHAIPINRKDCGLHLYGNLLPTTKEINAQKRGKTLETFLADKPECLQKIKSFMRETKYEEKVKSFADLQRFAEHQYQMILKLCENNKEHVAGLAPEEDKTNKAVANIATEEYGTTLERGTNNSFGRIFNNEEIQRKISNIAKSFSEEKLKAYLEPSISKLEPSISKQELDINYPLFVRVHCSDSQKVKTAAVKDKKGCKNRWTWNCKFQFQVGDFIYAICTEWHKGGDHKVASWLDKHKNSQQQQH